MKLIKTLEKKLNFGFKRKIFFRIFIICSIITFMASIFSIIGNQGKININFFLQIFLVLSLLCVAFSILAAPIIFIIDFIKNKILEDTTSYLSINLQNILRILDESKSLVETTKDEETIIRSSRLGLKTSIELKEYEDSKLYFGVPIWSDYAVFF